MNPEIPVCRDYCKLRYVCHPALRPETINIAGGTRTVRKEHLWVMPTWCRHYTCWAGGGETAAILAMQGEAEQFTVTETDGTVHDITGWTFGTSEKPTEKEKLRIVSDTGYVYSWQDDAYYATGKNVFFDDPSPDVIVTAPVS